MDHRGVDQRVAWLLQHWSELDRATLDGIVDHIGDMLRRILTP